MDNDYKAGYGKRPMWQWILIYVVIAAVVYGLVYYFAFAGKGGYSAPANTTGASGSAQVQTTPAATPGY